MKTTEDIVIDSIKDWQEKVIEVNIPLPSAGISTAPIAVAIISTVINMLLNTAGKAQRSCRGLKGRDHSLCIMKYRFEATKKAVSMLQSGKSKCKGDKKCIEKIDKKINQLKKKLNMFQGQVKMFKVRK